MSLDVTITSTNHYFSKNQLYNTFRAGIDQLPHSRCCPLVGLGLPYKCTSGSKKYLKIHNFFPDDTTPSRNLVPAMSALILPRPGASFAPSAPIPGPSESSFTTVFGHVLPAAQFLKTSTGKAAYYSIPPASTTPINGSSPDRVLFVHGVQTPAIGMFPIARALHNSFPSAHFVLLDLWGHGLSETPIAAYESSLFHNLIDDLLDHLRWDKVHLLGFSFGGALTVGYVASRPQRVQTYTLVAPAGLIPRSVFSEDEQSLIRGRDTETAEELKTCVVNILEGGDLIVPPNWQQRVANGEVVAEAVKDWQMKENPGHAAAVVAVFRDGGVLDNEEMFKKAVGTGLSNVVVLGETDGIVSKEQLVKLGFKNGDVHVVNGAGHGVVRERVEEIKGIVEDFWKSL
ncbi:Alpha/Beta hydrolase protein [Paraphoma chrysanthemicola]|uniref:Alpha/Beta hydrolase protein n=1 Tax=Paraphoma chrysanthemicola TaxID=798071 RepID=A0A8K0RBJ0_9PLEO|nr:Alpha/Beta hydrolase protein [Paraphoma chrysanthemicola]